MRTNREEPAPGDSARLRPGDRLPSLPGSTRIEGTGLGHRAGPRVVVTLHHAACDDCIRYATGLVPVLDQVRGWGGDIVVVAPGPSDVEAPRLTRAGVTLVRDTERVLAGEAAVLIADEWGEVFFASEPGDGHSGPSAEEVLEWVKFIAIQCPECEGPEGLWRGLQ